MKIDKGIFIPIAYVYYNCLFEERNILDKEYSILDKYPMVFFKSRRFDSYRTAMMDILYNILKP